MAAISIEGFLGENRALHPALLPNAVGVSSLNQKPGRGDLRPWRAPLNVATVPPGRKTIYRMGRDAPSDANYWLSWTATVHAVRGPNAEDSDERTYFTGSGTPKWTDRSKALASAPFPTAARELGVPAPSSACAVAATGGSSTLTETRYYTYTYVTDVGEESAPSPSPTSIVCKPDALIAITALAPAPSGNYGINRMRIYRTQSGQSGDANFYFVRQIASTLTQTTDDGRVLSEAMPSTSWLQPPEDLSWLTGLWNGMLAGISGRSVRVCEAYKPYAWPLEYEILPNDVTPVALATYGQTLVMLTTANPSFITGGTPGALDEQPIEFLQACIAPLSAVSMGHGVAWASPDGLAYVGSGAPRLLTDGVMTRDDWQAINPTSIVGCMHEGRYLGFYTAGGVRKGFMLDPSKGGMYFMDFGVDALYLDDLQDALYVLDGVNVQKWDSGAAKTVTFKSKLYQMPRPVQAYACANVTADTYPLTFKLWADGALKHTQTVTSSSPFRLPGGYYANTFQMEVSTSGQVSGVGVAHSLAEIGTT